MTIPATIPAAPQRIPSGYASIWALFTDWCAVTDVVALPAEPSTVVAFLTGCPCAPATGRRRVAAIDHHHTAAPRPRPGESAAVRSAIGRPVPDNNPPPPVMTDQVAAALRGLPSHGWTQGVVGHRDRCLLVLSQLAGVPYKHLAHMVVSSVQVANGAQP